AVAVEAPRIDALHLVELVELLAGRRVPQANGTVIAAARGEIPAVGGEGHRGDHALLVPFEPADLLARFDIPNADDLVPTTGGEHLAVGRKRDGGDIAVPDRANESV